ncbi:MAG: hypothetical protein Q4D05_09305 [Acinetobacter sp.]|nr:hypothetical protein [Acinetobacter sp.]
MKLLKYLIVASLGFGLTSPVIAGAPESIDDNFNSTVKFNHSKAQAGAIIEGCYHDPCSGTKVLDFKRLDHSSNSAMIELKLLGYSREWDSKKKEWNNEAHKVFVLCSIQAPSVILDGQLTTLPINSKLGVYGAIYNTYTFYETVCHGEDLSDVELAEKYGYDVRDSEL